MDALTGDATPRRPWPLDPDKLPIATVMAEPPLTMPTLDDVSPEMLIAYADRHPAARVIATKLLAAAGYAEAIPAGWPERGKAAIHADQRSYALPDDRGRYLERDPYEPGPAVDPEPVGWSAAGNAMTEAEFFEAIEPTGRRDQRAGRARVDTDDARPETTAEKINRVRRENALRHPGGSRRQRGLRPPPKPAPAGPPAIVGDERQIEAEWSKAQHRYDRYRAGQSLKAQAVASGTIERLPITGSAAGQRTGCWNAPHAGHRPTLQLILLDLLDPRHRNVCPHPAARRLFVEACAPDDMYCSVCLLVRHEIEKCLDCAACGASTPNSEEARRRNGNDLVLQDSGTVQITAALCRKCSRVARALCPGARNARD